MRLNAKFVVYAAVLAIAFVIAGSSPAQAQSTICPIDPSTNTPRCPVCPDFSSSNSFCSVQFTNSNGTCVTKFFELNTTVDQCTGNKTFTCTRLSKTKTPGVPCATEEIGDPTCEQQCIGFSALSDN